MRMTKDKALQLIEGLVVRYGSGEDGVAFTVIRSLVEGLPQADNKQSTPCLHVGYAIGFPLNMFKCEKCGEVYKG